MDPTVDGGLVVLIAIAMAIGLIGTILPILPGLPIIWGAALVYGLGEGFGTPGTISFAAISILLVIGMVAHFIVPQRRVSAAGAPTSTLVAGAVAGVIGFFVIPVVGLVVGAVVGVLLAERSRTSSWATAWVTTKSLLIGFGLGVLIELVTGVAMIGVWIAWVLLR